MHTSCTIGRQEWQERTVREQERRTLKFVGMRDITLMPTNPDDVAPPAPNKSSRIAVYTFLILFIGIAIGFFHNTNVRERCARNLSVAGCLIILASHVAANHSWQFRSRWCQRPNVTCTKHIQPDQQARYTISFWSNRLCIHNSPGNYLQWTLPNSKAWRLSNGKVWALMLW